MQKKLEFFPENFIIEIPTRQDWEKVNGILLTGGIIWPPGEATDRIKYREWEKYGTKTCFFIRQEEGRLTFGTIRGAGHNWEVFTVERFLLKIAVGKKRKKRLAKNIRRIIITKGE